MSTIGTAWSLAKKVEALLELEDKHGKAIAGIQGQIENLVQRVIALEGREELLMERAKSAAGMGAMAAMAEISRRVGGLETRAEIAIETRPRKRLAKQLPDGKPPEGRTRENK